jgi:hypothetical protein
LIASQGGFLGVYAEDELGTQDDDGTGLSSSDTSWGTATLGVGETLQNIGVYIPKGKSVGDLNGGTLTFVAERVGENQD